MKKEIDRLDATPSKRLFLSIIADYDLNKSICELIDNGLDVWVRNKKKQDININVHLDTNQQTIRIQDNAGGLAKMDLRFIVGPGQTGTKPTDETIGIFGVGTKRAVVALAQDIKIKTRYSKEKTYQVDFDDDWIQTEDWDLPYYEVDEIPEGTTIVELNKLRIHLSDDIINQLKEHLQITYAKFLNENKVAISINREKLLPIFFENWAYPPKYPPQRFIGTLDTEDGYQIEVNAVAGLSRESSPAAGEYGVYFYCNDRLIARGLKTYEVGFTKGFAGLPHPKISLTRIIISLKGDARAMPWNSSKSNINPNHEAFIALRNWILQVVKDYASLSRIWMGDWPEKVFKYDKGVIKEIEIADFPKVKKSYLPLLPLSKPRYSDIIIKKNAKISEQKPWARGLYESIIAADLLIKQKFEQKNRIVLIILDSALEIAFKEFLVNESGKVYNDALLISIFSNRTTVQNEIKKYVRLSITIWKKIDFYYKLRCKLVHERVTVGIHDIQIDDFRNTVEKVLGKLFKLKFS